MTEYILTWDDTPPSMNSKRSGYSAHHHVAHRAKKQWEGILFVMLNQAGVPKGWQRIEAGARLTFPDRRRRDAGNYRMLLEKALGDVLVAQGYIPDDTDEHFAFPYLTFEHGESRGMEIVLAAT